MPVEINELVIRAKVTESEQTTPNSGNTDGAYIDEAALRPIKKAVEEIMNILKRKNER